MERNPIKNEFTIYKCEICGKFNIELYKRKIDGHVKYICETCDMDKQGKTEEYINYDKKNNRLLVTRKNNKTSKD